MKAITILSLTSLGVLSSCQEQTPSQEQKPNVIYILADDLGYGDLSCYGQKRFETPHLDQLAQSGIRFTQHYAGNTVSAPSRCALMTGLHAGHGQVRGNRELKGAEGQSPLLAQNYTLAEYFKEQGYVTGAFGKWGLGYPGSEGDPNNQGFDEFYGYNCQRMAHRYYPTHLWHNQEKVLLEGNDWKNKVTYAPDVIHEQALQFIRDHKDEPFFAYIPIIQPHAELLAPDDEILTQFKGKYPETPFISKHKGKGPNYGDENFNVSYYCDQPLPHATFAAMVTRVDRYVGDIMATLKELGLEENTLIIFSSDNGPHVEGGADVPFFNSNGPLNGNKRSMTDGGIRVPMIASWKNRIKPGQTSTHISSFYDVLPTMAELTGGKLPNEIDGISFLPTLLQQQDQKQHEYLYWEHQGNVAVRYGDWKAVRYKLLQDENAEILLYHVKTDIEERNNVAAEHPEVIARIRAIMQEAHTPSLDFPLTASELKASKKQ